MTRPTSTRTDEGSTADQPADQPAGAAEDGAARGTAAASAPGSAPAAPILPTLGRPRLLLGAYALAPTDPGAEAAFFDGLRGRGVQSLEMPLPSPGTAAEAARWVATHLDDDVDLVVTAVPRTMQHLAADPAYGLSSADLDSRRAALDDLVVLRDLARRLAEEGGRPRLAAVELHSAPGPTLGTLAAFRESLDAMLAWDLGGARLLVEHCDALVEGQSPAKGFWSLPDEISVLGSLVGEAPETASRLGVSINWGRSAIEGRSARTPVEHVRAATEAGLLHAVVFSGAASTTTPWGPPWGDQHIALKGSDPALALSAGSLLGAEEIAETLRAARGATLDTVGIKVTARPDDADVAARLAVAEAALRLVSDALDAGRSGGAGDAA